MTTDENKQISRRIAEEGFGAGNFAVLDELAAPGPAAESRATFEMIRAAFPDLQVTVEDEIAEGDKVAIRVRLAGTHQGPLAGPMGTFPPTGKRAEWHANVIQEVRDGKLVGLWPQADVLGMLQQLGVMPTQGQ